MADHASSQLPYRPIVAKKSGQGLESTKLACKDIEDTRDNILAPAADGHKLPNADTPRDFAPTYERAPQLQSKQVQQSDKSKIETLEQISAENEAENEELRREYARRQTELEELRRMNIQLKARIQQLEQQQKR